MTLSTTIVGYLLLFVLSGLGFVLLNILIGSFLRPSDPHDEKLEIYECGEPTIGSSYVQFDLRFYVVALLFIIFDVEVAFFFPWAVVFGKSTQLEHPQAAIMQQTETGLEMTPAATGLLSELGFSASEVEASIQEERVTEAEVKSGLTKLILTCLADIGVFFAVLLVGFAYVWKRGDLDWVRAVTSQSKKTVSSSKLSTSQEREMVLSA